MNEEEMNEEEMNEEEMNETEILDRWRVEFESAIPYLLLAPSDFKNDLIKRLDELETDSGYGTFKKSLDALNELYGTLNTGFFRVVIDMYEEKQDDLLQRIKTLEKEVQELKAGKSVINVTNVCQHCNKKFETTRKHTKYCSLGCKQAAYRVRTKSLQ
jgi:hypothetical protein